MAKKETVRGAVSNMQYIEKTGRAMSYTDNPENATSVTFEAGGRMLSAMSIGFPPISEGDDPYVGAAVTCFSRGGG